MELRINVEYNEILKLVKQLSERDKKKLSLELSRDLKKKDRFIPKKGDNDESNEIQRLLLQGPVMSDEQFDDYKKMRH